MDHSSVNVMLPAGATPDKRRSWGVGADRVILDITNGGVS